MMKLSLTGFDLIKSFEGFYPHSYICPGGYPTIGYGHVLAEEEDYPNGISIFEAERMLKNDVLIAEKGVHRYIEVPLNQNQFDALTSFTFNLGCGALQRSTLRRKINQGHHEDVPEELMRWVWAGGRRLRGLVRRRAAEAALYQS